MTVNVYAKAGEALQQIGGDMPEGWVAMDSQRPEGDYVASETGEWVARKQPYAQALAALNATYSADRLQLCQAWLVAAVADGVAETERKADVEAELKELDAQHAADIEELKTKYGVS